MTVKELKDELNRLNDETTIIFTFYIEEKNFSWRGQGNPLKTTLIHNITGNKLEIYNTNRGLK